MHRLDDPLLRELPRLEQVKPPLLEFDALFTADRTVIFAHHGNPTLIHRLTYRRTNAANIHVRGYEEEGTATPPFDTVLLSGLDRFHLIIDVIDGVPGLGTTAAPLRQRMVDERVEGLRLHPRIWPGGSGDQRRDVALRRGVQLMNRRRALSGLGLSTGKRARLYRILYRHGLGNGTAMFLPYDQGLEHGPRDFFANPAAADPAYIVRLAVEGGFNGVALQVGNAEKFYADVAGEVPLILKLNGRTELPPADAPFSPLNASVRDAVRLGADAIGYTLYVGSSRQAEDFAQFRMVREDAEAQAMPIIVWAYPRGSAVENAGGQDSFYAIDYAARTAAEVGADIVKVNVPDPSATQGVKAPYDRSYTTQQAVAAVVASAGRAQVVFSGGTKAGDETVLSRTREAMDAGAIGVIYGRNIWQREHDESLRFTAKITDILARYPNPTETTV